MQVRLYSSFLDKRTMRRNGWLLHSHDDFESS